MVMETGTPEETFLLGKKLGEMAEPGMIYCLDGDLTMDPANALEDPFAAGLGIDEPVNSPTFTILQQYDGGRMPLYHFDVYRIGDVEEMEEIGCEDCFYGEGVCLIEWAEKVGEIIPPEALHIRIEKDLSRGLDYRKITVEEKS